MNRSPSQPAESPKRLPWAFWGIFVAALALGGWAARRTAFSVVKAESVRMIRTISKSLPEASPPGGDPTDDLLFPLWPLDSVPSLDGLPSEQPREEAAALAGEASVKKSLPKKSKGWRPPAVSALGPRPENSRATIDRVLKWASQELVPQGITRPAEEGIPSGIELYGVGALGIGLLDGDRLVTVDGVSVLERGQVVGAVLGARSRRAESMTAGLVRRTKEGPVPFTVIVEQPYPEHVPDLEATEPDERAETAGEVLPEPAEQRPGARKKP